MPDQEQPDEIEKCLVFDLIDLKSFKPQGNSIEQFLIADTNSHQGSIYGAYVTTHRISARILAQVQGLSPIFRCSPTIPQRGHAESPSRTAKGVEVGLPEKHLPNSMDRSERAGLVRGWRRHRINGAPPR